MRFIGRASLYCLFITILIAEAAHPVSGGRQKRQLEGIHDTQTVTVTKGSLRQALRQHFLAENNIYVDVSPQHGHGHGAYSGSSSSQSNMMMIRRHRENDGLLSCRKCGGYSSGRKGRCCASCDLMGYNGCWCKTCDCLCYNY